MISAKVIQLGATDRARRRSGMATQNQKFADGIVRAAQQIAADSEAIHDVWVTIVRPGGLVEQIGGRDCAAIGG